MAPSASTRPGGRSSPPVGPATFSIESRTPSPRSRANDASIEREVRVTRFRPTVVEVDLDAVRHNVRLLKPERAELLAVVKADGYGHGAAEVARAALSAGASRLGVALVEEGIGLRERGIDAPILVLTEPPRGSEKDALAARLTPTVYSPECVASVSEAADALARRVGVHLKVDTGMHRGGVWPSSAVSGVARRVVGSGLELEGVWTPFAAAEGEEEGTRDQLRALLETRDALAT